ncbi:MAG TPA: hypothetical protein VI793_17825 [Anaerolineales bacterium]|nr:hypothetical protein [Anaerolineales bacterium]
MSAENWVFLMLGALLSIPLSIAANLLTPRFQNWLDRRALSVHGKTLERLKEELHRVRMMNENPKLLYYIIINRVLLTLIAILTCIVLAAFTVLFWLSALGSEVVNMPYVLSILKFSLMSVLMLTSLLLLNFVSLRTISNLYALVLDLIRLLNFGNYEKDTLTRIAELEGRKPRDQATDEQSG